MYLLNRGIKHTRINPVMNDKTVSAPNSWTVVSVSNFPPQNPAIRFPKKLVKNQHPITSDKNFLGANFVTRDKPIGDKHNSAIVIIKYAKTNHNGETKFVSDKNPAKVNIKNENEIKNKAIPNFSTEVGSLEYFLSHPQRELIIGANVIMNKGFNDWK